MNDETQKHDFYMSIGESDWAKIEPIKKIESLVSKCDEIMRARLFPEPFEIDIPLKDESGILNDMAQEIEAIIAVKKI